MFSSCSNQDAVTPTQLEGQWINVNTPTDTLFFKSMENMEVMTLHRAMEIKNGVEQPESGSGTYQYRLTEGSIAIKSLFSSSMIFDDYYFNVEEMQFSIGAFYGSDNGKLLHFEKID
ncbi:hypothetical protein GCM10023331_10580 [Algivirga pacifica]|uniref:Lipocalin-like domain-containing protein n=1 Tax=Algivirga pacifica TaxID=1162670 RepID=A0ABP9D5C8_9BACT